MSDLRTSVILILQPLRQGYNGKVVGIDVDRMVKNKPRLGVRDVAVKLNIVVDENLFIEPEPEVTIRLDDKRVLVVPEIEPVINENRDPEDGVHDGAEEEDTNG